MKSIKVAASLMALLLALGLILVLSIHAQEPTEEAREEQDVQTQNVGELGLADPPPTGFSVLYIFTGVANRGSQVATSVHCTNFGSNSISVTVELFNDSAVSVFDGTTDVSANETDTYSSQDTFYTELSLGASLIEQGSGRVLATDSTVICTAQLLQPNTLTPAFMVKLPLFKIPRVYLPIIRKSS